MKEKEGFSIEPKKDAKDTEKEKTPIEKTDCFEKTGDSLSAKQKNK